MKKVFLIIVIIYIVGMAVGCSKSTIVDFERETFQSISVWTYNFKEGTSVDNWVYRKADTEEILDYLINLKGSPVKEVDLVNSSEVAYGVMIMADEDIKLTFIDEYVVTSDGQYYKIDFEEVQEQLVSIENNTREFDFIYMLNQRYVSLIDGLWDVTYMTKSPFDEVDFDGVNWESSEGIITQDKESLSYTISNNREGTLEYGEEVEFEVFLENNWYDVRAMTKSGTEIGWHSILNILESGQSQNGGFYLEYYQPLPTGKYRIVKSVDCSDGYTGVISLEFTIGK